MVHINDTLRFILPMFYNSKQGLGNEFFFNEFFMGAYTSDLEHPEYDDKLILRYRYFPCEEFAKFEATLIEALNPTVCGGHDPDTFLYVLNIPDEYLEDYSLILTGVFDKINPNLKLKIIKMWGLTESDGLFKILAGKEEYEGEPFENEILNLNEEDDVEEIL